MDFAKGVHRALRDRGIPEVDWYRQAQQRSEWGTRAVYGILEEQIPELKERREKQGGTWDGQKREDAWAARQIAGKSDKRTGGRPGGKEILLTDSGNYKCPVCNKLFVTKIGFSSHYSKMHGVEEIIRQEGGGRLACKLCGRAFRNQGVLTRHVRDVREQPEKALMFNKCGKVCKSNRGLEFHMKTHGD